MLTYDAVNKLKFIQIQVDEDNERAQKLARKVENIVTDIADGNVKKLWLDTRLEEAQNFTRMAHKEIDATEVGPKNDLRDVLKQISSALDKLREEKNSSDEKPECDKLKYKLAQNWTPDAEETSARDEDENINERNLDRLDNGNRSKFENDDPLPRGKSRCEPEVEAPNEYKELCSECLRVSIYRATRQFNHSCKNCQRSKHDGQAIRVLDHEDFWDVVDDRVDEDGVMLKFIERPWDELGALYDENIDEWICCTKQMEHPDLDVAHDDGADE